MISMRLSFVEFTWRIFALAGSGIVTTISSSLLQSLKIDSLTIWLWRILFLFTPKNNEYSI